MVKVRPLLDVFGNWKRLFDRSVEEAVAEKIRLHERTGRPFGTDEFIETLEKQLGRKLTPGKQGPKEKQKFANHDLSELSMVSRNYKRGSGVVKQYSITPLLQFFAFN